MRYSILTILVAVIPVVSSACSQPQTTSQIADQSSTGALQSGTEAAAGLADLTIADNKGAVLAHKKLALNSAGVFVVSYATAADGSLAFSIPGGIDPGPAASSAAPEAVSSAPVTATIVGPQGGPALSSPLPITKPAGDILMHFDDGAADATHHFLVFCVGEDCGPPD